MRLQMQQNPTNSFEWAQKYSTQETCLEDLNRHRWKNGFACPKYGHDNSWRPKHSHLHECTKCARHVSPTAGTVFELTRLPLSKWFVATYLMGADKGGSSVQQLFKKVGASWSTACPMSRNLRRSKGDRDRGYWLGGCIMFSSKDPSRAGEVADQGQKAGVFSDGATREWNGFHGR